MTNFITNDSSKSLKKRLEELIQHSQQLKFLVGFFYFSGWQELYESLKTRPDLSLHILVGLETDRALGQVFEIARESGSASSDELAERFFQSLHHALNDEALDTALFHEQVAYFVDMLESGRLQIRKTLDPNHAKLYLFRLKDELRTLFNQGGKFITGSSNLTRAGILSQNEFNVEIGDYGWREAEAYFDTLWATAIPITEVPARKDKLIRLVRHQTQAAEVTPFEAYALVLKTYLDLAEQKTLKPHVKRLLEARGYRDYRYQSDAVNQALTILEEYNGVIIADVVGLGKSIIACMLAHQLGQRGMVICPPGLMGDARRKDSGWWKYLEDFKLYGWEVRSCGLLEDALAYLQTHGEDVGVIIVDEAHRFRNEDTQAYELLSAICRGRKVILLTATPFSNSPADIFALLKLFDAPGKSRISLDENLEARFGRYNAEFRALSYILRYYNHPIKEKRQRAEKYYADLFSSPLPVDLPRLRARAAQLAEEIRGVLSHVLIRRNRLDLKTDPVYSREVTALSDVAEPGELFYELTPEQMDFYTQVIEQDFSENGRFHGAIYQPFAYEKSRALQSETLDEEASFTYEQQRNLYEFMRRLLVKRFESSFGAFARSIANFIHVHERVLAFIQNSGGRYILDRQLIEQIYQSDPDEIDAALQGFAERLAHMHHLSKHQRIYVIRDFDRADDFLRDIQSDLDLLREIQRRVEKLNLVARDPKAERLKDEIHRLLRLPPQPGEPRRKVIVFTEYTDTVAHLLPILEREFNGKVIGASGDLSANRLSEILASFDASLEPSRQRDDYDILLTTDKLSEGVNLNRAGVIINYDIPWNPTRVIQRLGRINRIGKKVFETLYLYNFFPTEKGADIVKSREVAAQKMFLIHNTLGEDARIFSADETPTPAELYRRVNRNPEEEEEPGLLTRLRQTYFEIRTAHPEVIERIAHFPPRVKTAKASDRNQLLVFRRKGLGLFIQSVEDTTQAKPEIHTPLLEDALRAIACPVDEPRLPLGPRFWPCYEAIKTYREPSMPKSEASLETRALLVLQSALRNPSDDLLEYLPFLRTLIEDLRDYKTLPKSTLRRFADLNPASQEFRAELEATRRYLGENYLEVIKHRAQGMKSEVIIAVENRCL